MDFSASALSPRSASGFSPELDSAGRALAAPNQNGAAPEMEFVPAPFLIFRLGASLFGVPALAVREIQPLPALSPLPETAPFIVGVFNLRGAIVPVMDLNARLGQHAAPYRVDDCLIVLSFDGADVAILVNEVRAVEPLSAAQIQAVPAPGHPSEMSAPFAAGVVQIDEGIVMLLHLPHLLSWPDFASIPATSEETAAPRFELQMWTPAERAILEERAARVRHAADEAHNHAERAPVALVALGGEEFGIELSTVREFLSLGAVTPVPCCPPHILGQINLRGDIVTLLDVRAALRTTRTAPPYFEGASSRRGAVATVPVVVVEHEGAPVGIAIDQVCDVLYLREGERLALDVNLQGGQGGKYFAGGTLHDGRLLPLLDVARLLAEGELDVDEGA